MGAGLEDLEEPGLHPQPHNVCSDNAPDHVLQEHHAQARLPTRGTVLFCASVY